MPASRRHHQRSAKLRRRRERARVTEAVGRVLGGRAGRLITYRITRTKASSYITVGALEDIKKYLADDGTVSWVGVDG